ncbi:MAG: heat-inducible transcriptional repressor HrcA [Solirubrobacteraceae bacterium]
MLSERQELILRKVVEGHSDAGAPVGSKLLAADVEVTWGPSTVRHELAVLEEHGLLAHPHTSAGRVPTDAGYRYFVDQLLAAPREPGAALGLSLVRLEIDDAMRETTETLSQVTDLLAIVSAPPIETATVRHVEVIVLQPRLLMVVVITSTGGVTKRIFPWEDPIDTGLAKWAASYLNERLTGLGLGARMLAGRLADPALSAAEQDFLDGLAPVFTDLAGTSENTLYVDGAARLIGEHRFQDVTQLNELMEMLERRVVLLGVLGEALQANDLYVRIGAENDLPALQSLAVVATAYGLPRRSLGTVSVIGPRRMDYATAISSVRGAALVLSRFVEDVYDE